MKTIKELKKFIDEWADFVGLDDFEFKEALMEEFGIELLLIGNENE